MNSTKLEKLLSKYQIDIQAGQAFLAEYLSKEKGPEQPTEQLAAQESLEDQTMDMYLDSDKTADFEWINEQTIGSETGGVSYSETKARYDGPVTGSLTPLRDDLTKKGDFLLERYEVLGVLGTGGMGQVYQVKEMELNRTLAMKVLHRNLLWQPTSIQSFIEEGQICAQLQHPNIVPVHEFGKLDDGRLYFTMKEIKGIPFSLAIKEVHASVRNEQWQITETGLSFWKLIDFFHDVCRAVAYAHSKGVIHRDLKPSNIMIGKYGEVLVVDWGIAKLTDQPGRLSRDEDTLISIRYSQFGQYRTLDGEVTGTPSYMAPEQARGEIRQIDNRTDIYALGAILYEILAGRKPYVGSSGQEILTKVLSGPPEAIRGLSSQNGDGEMPPLPEELVDACQKAMSRDKEDRFQLVEEFAQVLSDWLDGSKSREKALSIVEAALAFEAQAKEVLSQAKMLREEVKEELKSVPLWEGEAAKSIWWEKEAQARELTQRAHFLETMYEQKLQNALSHKPDLEEGHLELARQYHRLHKKLESLQGAAISPRIELNLREHVEALPSKNQEKKTFLHYLKGDGALSLQTTEGDAEIFLERATPQHRRLVYAAAGKIGTGALDTYSLNMGSYRLRIRKDDGREVLYPFRISRGEHWDARLDYAGKEHRIYIPQRGEIGADECFVPAGWYWAGGDDRTSNGLPLKRVWVNDVVIRKFSVTNRDYLEFLNDLVKQGRKEEALQWVPRERSGHASEMGAMIYGQEKNGLFVLVPDADGDLWHPDWPVLMIDVFCAKAYCDWMGEKIGRPYRLLHELEWEKAARGVDKRTFPWGNGFDPSYACMNASHPNYSLPAVVDSFPIDESVYGIRGMAGNVRTWTGSQRAQTWNELRETSVLGDGNILCREELMEGSIKTRELHQHIAYTLKGGCWNVGEPVLRAAERWSGAESIRMEDLGLRFGYSLRSKR